MEFNLVNHLLMPLLIFVARVADVSIGTLRLIFVSKGLKYIAPVLGFFEVLIWIVATGKIMQGETTILIYIFYALGFAAGNYVGMVLEEKLAVGKVLVRIVIQKKSHELAEKLRELGYPTTIVNGEGKDGRVKVAFSIVNKKNLNEVKEAIHKINPKAFYTIEDVKYANETNGIAKGKSRLSFLRLRKSK